MGALKFVIKLLSALIITIIGLIWSMFVLSWIFIFGLKNGFFNIFHQKDRTKGPVPIHYNAWDEETRHNPGPNMKPWNHAYVTVPESEMRFHYVYSGKKPKHLSISSIDGQTTLERNSDENGDTKLMLCLHGFPENWFSWRHMLRYFDSAPYELSNYFVVAIDLRGYGDSDKPRSRDAYHLNALVSDVKGVAKQLGYEKFVLLGHDWGGMISWTVALIYPEILEKCIILSCPYFHAVAETIRKKPLLLLKMTYVIFFQIPFLPEYLVNFSDHKFLDLSFNDTNAGIQNSDNRLTTEELEVFKYSMRNSATCALNFYRAAIWPFCKPPPLDYPRIRRKEKRLHAVPILLIWGGKDVALDKLFAENTKKHLNPDNGSRMVVLEKASHWVQQDFPQETIKHTTEFIRS